MSRPYTGPTPDQGGASLATDSGREDAGNGDSGSPANASTQVAMAFRERPYYDPWLLKTHPTRVFFDAFILHQVPGGVVPVLVSSVLVDTAVRH